MGREREYSRVMFQLVTVVAWRAWTGYQALPVSLRKREKRISTRIRRMTLRVYIHKQETSRSKKNTKYDGKLLYSRVGAPARGYQSERRVRLTTVADDADYHFLPTILTSRLAAVAFTQVSDVPHDAVHDLINRLSSSLYMVMAMELP